MKFSLSKKLLFNSGLIAAILFIDQITKIWARSEFKGREAVVYWSDFFRFEYAENTGAFLSLGAQFSETARILVFNVAVGLFLIYVGYLLIKKAMPFWQMLAFVLLLAGGLSNLFDRIFRGAVIDFMNMGLGNLRTGIFNVADMAIMAGLIIMILPDRWLENKTPEFTKNL